MKCLFPRLPITGLEAVLINTAGGVTGGDRFAFTAQAQSGTDLTLTTQACERAYRALGGQTGNVTTRLRASDGARINWLPQETLLFQGCALERRLSVDLTDDASFLMVEPLIFGRREMGEVLTEARFSDRIEINRDGAPVYLDAMKLTGDVRQHLARPFTGNGAGAMASLVYITANAEAQLAPVRDLLPATGGASLLQPDVLVMRLLAEDGFALRKTLIPVLNRLRGGPLPRCWMI